MSNSHFQRGENSHGKVQKVVVNSSVQILPGIRYPAIIGFEKVTINGTFILPPEIPKGGPE